MELFMCLMNVQNTVEKTKVIDLFMRLELHFINSFVTHKSETKSLYQHIETSQTNFSVN